MKKRKHREFWLCWFGDEHFICPEQRDDGLHVIEKSAYDELQELNQTLRVTIKNYQNRLIEEMHNSSKLAEALDKFAFSVDDSLLLDENLHKDWDKLRREVILARSIVKEYRGSDEEK